jgi:hypothetical protein
MRVVKRFIWLIVALLVLGSSGLAGAAAQPIVLGCPLSTAFLYGWDAERGIKLAVEEINQAGSDYQNLQRLSAAFNRLESELDAAIERWTELAERAEA